MDRHLVKRSRFLSLVLRHEPQRIGLELDAQGWAGIDDLIEKAGAHGQPLDRSLLDRIVSENDKQRFILSADGLRIRANQGHSVDNDLGLAPQQPPDRLYHGTAGHNLRSIQATGLNAGSRRHVHLSTDTATAVKVGQRHGTPVVLVIASDRMFAAGHVFYRAENGVWLTEAVPLPFIRFPAT